MRGASIRRAILVGASPERKDWVQKELKRLLPKGVGASDLLIGVDGGLDTCLASGLIPDWMVGDGDSTRSRGLSSWVPTVSLPREKDRSDLHSALNLIGRLGIAEVHCLGISGGRADHHLAALFDLGAFVGQSRHLSRLQVSSHDVESFFIRPGMRALSWRASKKSLFSVFAWGGVVRGLQLPGAYYQAGDGRLSPSSQGLSNWAVSSKVSVKLDHGILYVVIPRSKKSG